MRILLMPLIRPIATKALRQAASASASSERAWLGRRLGCRISSDPWWRCKNAWQRHNAIETVKIYYQELQPRPPFSHKKNPVIKTMTYVSAGQRMAGTDNPLCRIWRDSRSMGRNSAARLRGPPCAQLKGWKEFATGAGCARVSQGTAKSVWPRQYKRQPMKW